MTLTNEWFGSFLTMGLSLHGPNLCLPLHFMVDASQLGPLKSEKLRRFVISYTWFASQQGEWVQISGLLSDSICQCQVGVQVIKLLGDPSEYNVFIKQSKQTIFFRFLRSLLDHSSRCLAARNLPAHPYLKMTVRVVPQCISLVYSVWDQIDSNSAIK